jgi:hypothetical protein
MRFCNGILAGVLLVGTVGTIPATAQTASRLGLSITAIPTFTNGNDVAYDPKDSMYLVVGAYGGNLNGRFVKPAGDLLDWPFVIQPASLGFTHFPGVAYSPDAFGGRGGFLVTWHQSIPGGGATVHARMVKFSSDTWLGPESQISSERSSWDATAHAAYSTVSKEFLVVWQGAGAQIRAQRIGNWGEMLGTNLPITLTDYHRDPSVAYNPTTNEFLLVYAGADAISPFVVARRVAAGSGALLGGETLLSRARGIWITNVAYNPVTNRYLAAWYQGGTFGRLLDAAANIVSDVFVVSTRFTAYDGLGLDYNPSNGSFMYVAQDAYSSQDGAVELSWAGIPDIGFVATDSPVPVNHPRVAARTDKAEWLMTATANFASVIVQALQSTRSGDGPPPCATPMTSVNLLNPTATFRIDVTAPSTCFWSVSSATPWLLVSSGASGTGDGSVSITALRNTGAAGRTGTLTIGGKTVTVQQAGFNAAAVHGFIGSGYSDLLWQHQTTGEISIWEMRGNSVISTQPLGSPGIADTSWKIAGSGDLNGDGYADIVWQKTDGYVAAWLTRGTAVIATAMLSSPYVGPNWKIRAVGDVNGDGKADIIWQHDTDGSLAVWLMNGAKVTSTLMLSVPTMPDPNWTIVGAGDINRDGKADIIWQNQATGGLGAWLMNGATVIMTQNLSVPFMTDLTWKIRGVGDLNGDGYADLIWQNVVTGDLGVWYLNGFTVIGQTSLYTSTGVAFVPDINWMIVGPG